MTLVDTGLLLVIPYLLYADVVLSALPVVLYLILITWASEQFFSFLEGWAVL